jgi:hypothetical protein
MKKVWDKIVAFQRTLHQSPLVVKIIVSLVTLAMVAMTYLLCDVIATMAAQLAQFQATGVPGQDELLKDVQSYLKLTKLATLISIIATYVMFVTTAGMWSRPEKPKGEGGRCEKPVAEGAA